ncbi:unnamed protein product [Cylicocyclus nassatus]|uniref:Uncharacterized protein n=1 Tax=Cylicocyclus nassatus TaxID=53992 RepID=A0AA36GLA7_CYLNA|nr:unnamed protein product [Cylicocyclus nassatus]
MARVSCSTNGGFGPPSDWITFNTTAITAFKDGTEHDQVSNSKTLHRTHVVILGTAVVFANRLNYL